MSDVQVTAGEALRHALPAGLLHDLRTPLNQIIGFSEMLLEQAQETGQDSSAADLQKVCNAGQRLLALMEGSFQPIYSPAAAAVDPPPAAGLLSEGPLSIEGESGSGEAVDLIAISGLEQGALLVVDDNEANREVLSRRLERQGHAVTTIDNGRRALELLHEQAFELVLLDIMMPEMDGYEVLRQLKADERLQHIPVIMISALSELDSVVRCIEMGAEDYLYKPFNPVLLKARIGACLEKKRAHDREAALYQQLQENYWRLEELEKLHEDLTNMIVHDMRTPLTSVMAGMQTLDMVGELNEQQQEVKAIAVDGAESLMGMINDLLDVEKMESGSMELDYGPLDASELIAGAVAQVASLIESESLTLVLQIAPDLPLFQGDENKLRRVLVNLLGNAIKFTPSGGVLTIEARFSEDGKSLVFSVKDTGEGIPQEAFERIFEKFGQVKSRRSGRVMSTGLGLTFCRLAVEAHGGHIGVESEPGQGSTFYFEIPIAA